MREADLSAKRGCAADLATYPRAVKRSFDPRGRSTRTELALLIILPYASLWVLSFVLEPMLPKAASGIWLLAIPIFILAPVPASAARRLHDIGKNGWLALPIVMICSVAIWAVWKDIEAGPYETHDLFANNPIADWIFAGICLAYSVILMQPPNDTDNPYGPDPRPAPKEI